MKPIKKIAEDFMIVQRHSKENYMSMLRITAYSEDMPFEDRLAACKNILTRAATAR
ncbi:MAG: hypothetical protein FWF05_00050 [Oscillospiraceae bacterium]|nr:hypothetical protein [Oscillospiraceae bacterium]